MADFRPFEARDGYPPLEDFGLVGDGTTAALVGRDGSIPWLCAPRFDDPPVFCGLLDRERGGALRVAPEGLVEGRQSYVEDSGVVATELKADGGVVRITDFLPLRPGADLTEEKDAGCAELARLVEVVHGRVRLHLELDPRAGIDLPVALRCDRDLPARGTGLDLEEGETVALLLGWGEDREGGDLDLRDRLDETTATWARWMEGFDYRGPQEALVRRSAITLKLLDHFENGAIVAAPTSSLPEEIGGERNWDYRYAWIRDAAFSVYALRRIGCGVEAWSFLSWVLRAIDEHGRPRVLYALDASKPVPEVEDDGLEGYRGSAPVRWGNDAVKQRQHDVFGEVVDCAYQWAEWGGEISPRLWRRLVELIDAAGREWNEPDHGIWEIRAAERPFTYSAALCHVALERGARLAEDLGLPGDVDRWRSTAATIRKAILEEAWNEEIGAITESLGGEALDASVLSLPLRRVVAADHPKMASTTRVVSERLGAGDGLLYRYLPDESPDGLSGHEGAFLLCSFWLVDNLAGQDRLDEALELYDSLCGRVNDLGLLPEQVDPSSSAFLGNFPQAFSHVGLASSGVTLARHLGLVGSRTPAQMGEGTDRAGSP